MPCETFKDGAGRAIGMVCSGRRRSKPCTYCGRASAFLCDFPILKAGKAATCDLPLCDRCTWRISGDRDLCLARTALWDSGTDQPKVGPGAAP